MSKVIHFEISAKDPERANEFYSKAFGWNINPMGGPMEYWLADAGPKEELGINGAISRGEVPQVVITISVDDIKAAADAVVAAGGKVLTDIREVPNVGLTCYCDDTEGNKFAMMQMTAMAQA